MRIFQNCGGTRTYVRHLNRLAAGAATFRQRLDVFMFDRFAASHILEPALSAEEFAFLTNAEDLDLQRLWAVEAGLPANTPPEHILLSHIEQHRAEVFYNMNPVLYQSDFVRKLPGCVKRSIAWRAAPSPGADFGAYDLVVCNFPSILQSYVKRGWRARYFAPAHDPVLDEYAFNEERPIDVLFVGSYSRHHMRRAVLLEAVARLGDRFNVAMHLDQSRFTRLAQSPLGRLLPFARYRVPPAVHKVSKPTLFGREMYSALSRSKIVLNGAIDMAGHDRGNMRCFEALGARCLLLTDQGEYPAGMVAGETLVTYGSAEEAASRIVALLDDAGLRRRIAESGNHMIRAHYSKRQQYEAFLQLVSAT
jgi:glycosyltransferase involved in cell wall biosynthesis